MFVDRVKIELNAGNGGNGVIAWRREKYIPKGGPYGGNGGLGGSILFEADANVASLDGFKHKRIIKAKDGGAGGSNCCQGKNGENLTLKVPCGTLVKDAKTGEILFDFTESGTKWTACVGGKGGKGNHAFRSSTNRAPHICTPGLDGEIREIELELKLIADVGLIGFPNAGKSTLISKLARVKVKIAPYPFTTLHPNLGFIYYKDNKRVLLADIPGIIEGAHNNRGLGIEFLRHIERTKALIFVIDSSGLDGRNPLDDFKVLQKELSTYDPELLNRPFLIALNKCDLLDSEENVKEFIKAFPAKVKKQIYQISAETGDGCDKLQAAIEKMID